MFGGTFLSNQSERKTRKLRLISDFGYEMETDKKNAQFELIWNILYIDAALVNEFNTKETRLL